MAVISRGEVVARQDSNPGSGYYELHEKKSFNISKLKYTEGFFDRAIVRNYLPEPRYRTRSHLVEENEGFGKPRPNQTEPIQPNPEHSILFGGLVCLAFWVVITEPDIGIHL